MSIAAIVENTLRMANDQHSSRAGRDEDKKAYHVCRYDRREQGLKKLRGPARVPVEISPRSWPDPLAFHDVQDAQSVALQQPPPVGLGSVSLNGLAVVIDVASAPDVQDVQISEAVRQKNHGTPRRIEHPSHLRDPSGRMFV